MSLLISILGILITIFLVIGVHEFGHFIVARLAGIKVLRFSIGFGKALARWHDKKGTEYVIAAIPLGGYVKLLDETEGHVPQEEIHLSFNHQPLYKKTAVVLAGPFFNLLFAIFIYWILFVVGFTTIKPIIGQVTPNSIAANAGIHSQQEILSIDRKPTNSWTMVIVNLISRAGDKESLQMETKDLQSAQAGQMHSLNLSTWQLDKLKPDPLASLGIMPYEPEIPMVIGVIAANSPASQSPLKKGDKIISVENKKINNWLEFVTEVGKNPEKTLTITVKRDGKLMPLPVKLGYKRTTFFQKQGYLGIGPTFEWPKEFLRTNQYGPLQAIPYAWNELVTFTQLNFLILGKMLMGKISLQSLGGPITIFETAGTALNTGLIPFLSFLAFLSISIGILNILPIPGLDGGFLLFHFIEFVIRRPLSFRVQMLMYRFGLIILMLLIVQALVNDVLRL